VNILNWAKLAVSLLQTIAWPATLLVSLFLFRTNVAGLIDRIQHANLKLPGGLEFNLDDMQQVATSAAAAGAAAARPVDSKPLPRESITQIAGTITDSIVQRSKDIRRPTVLWVDDVPDNNSDIIEALRALKIDVSLAGSTDVAMRLFASQKFDLIISDMYRPPDPEAGLTLVKQLRQLGNQAPVFIFAARWAAEHTGQEADFGVQLITNSGQTLFNKAVGVLAQK
jgi:CheY-like chemotaxis protein